MAYFSEFFKNLSQIRLAVLNARSLNHTVLNLLPKFVLFTTVFPSSEENSLIFTPTSLKLMFGLCLVSQ